MSSFSSLKDQLEEMHLQDTAGAFTSWQEQGIAHGFLGLGESIPSFDHCKQVHGTSIVEHSAETSGTVSSRIEADGLYSRQKDLPIAVQTADCVPVLFHSSDLVMAVHAGWKGLRSGILQEAIGSFKDKEYQVGIGPHISQASFEVGPEVMLEFENSAQGWSDLQLAHISNKGVDDRWHLDLGLAAAFNLMNLGVKPQQITLMKTCTKLENEFWHSYRRDALDAGRNWSWISL